MNFKIILISCLVLLTSNTLWGQKVVATTTITADIAQNIAGEVFEIIPIVPLGGDPHLYEPVPKDPRLIQQADLILVNGLTLEGWLTEFIDNSGTDAAVVTVTEGIQPITSKKYNTADPHAWMTAENGVVYAKNIFKALSNYAPEHKALFQQNFNNYKRQLEQLELQIFQEVQQIPAQQRVLITSHDAFQYFGQHYGVRLESILGTSTDAEAQTADVIRVQKAIQETKVPSIFIESTINPKLLKQIAADNNIEIGGELYSDSLGELGGEADTYLKMLRHNATTISYGLRRKDSEVLTDEAMQKGITSKQVEEDLEDTINRSPMNYAMIAIIAVLLLGGFGLMYRKMNI